MTQSTGYILWFTGLSGAGKSTLAGHVSKVLREKGARVEVLDGDEVRENLSKHRGKSFYDIINLSVSETLSRTILTSGATMLSVLAFFIWGTGVIKDFAFAMVIGIVAGTYSSIYVAAPLTEYIDKRVRDGSTGTKRRPPGPPAAQAARA